MKTKDGRLYVISGKSRSGKSAYTVRAVAKLPRHVAGRLVAWDPEDQWAKLPGWRRVTEPRELLAILRAQGSFKVAYVAAANLAAEFDYWAGCVNHAAVYVGPLACIAEELADVSSPGKAPDNWGKLLRRGLKRGAHIFAISQRWAEADKTALGNHSEFVTFQCASHDDARYVARKIGIAFQEVAALQGTYDAAENLKVAPYIRKTLTGQIERNALRFK